MSIGIAATSISGIGVTTKLPSTVFAVKLQKINLKLQEQQLRHFKLFQKFLIYQLLVLEQLTHLLQRILTLKL